MLANSAGVHISTSNTICHKIRTATAHGYGTSFTSPNIEVISGLAGVASIDIETSKTTYITNITKHASRTRTLEESILGTNRTVHRACASNTSRH